MKLSPVSLVANLGVATVLKKQAQISPKFLLPTGLATIKVNSTNSIQNIKQLKPTITTGIIIDKSGLVMTTAKSFNRKDNIIVVTKSGQSSKAKFIRIIPQADIALLQIIDVPKHLDVARIGDAQKIEVKQQVRIFNFYSVRCQQEIRAQITGLIARRLHETGELIDYLQLETTTIQQGLEGIVFNQQNEIIGIASKQLINGGNSQMGIAVGIDMAKKALMAFIK